MHEKNGRSCTTVACTAANVGLRSDLARARARSSSIKVPIRQTAYLHAVHPWEPLPESTGSTEATRHREEELRRPRASPRSQTTAVVGAGIKTKQDEVRDQMPSGRAAGSESSKGKTNESG